MRQLGAMVGLVVLCGCGGGGGSPTPPSKTPQAITVNPIGTTLIKIAQEQPYTASIRYSDGTEATVTATWQSDNQNVATIDGTGKAVGLNSGEATLIARADGLTGTLKIRVVPDYQGTWDGQYLIRSCRASGSFDPKDWCSADGFKAGQRLPIVFAMLQERERLSGSILIGSLEHLLDSSSAIRIDGGAALSGKGSYEAEDLTVNTNINPSSVRAQGPTLTGTFTMTFTLAGYSGSASFDADLSSVTRSSVTAVPLAAPGGPFSSVRELMLRTKVR
jgi:hypothetical protein